MKKPSPLVIGVSFPTNGIDMDHLPSLWCLGSVFWYVDGLTERILHTHPLLFSTDPAMTGIIAGLVQVSLPVLDHTLVQLTSTRSSVLLLLEDLGRVSVNSATTAKRLISSAQVLTRSKVIVAVIGFATVCCTCEYDPGHVSIRD